MYCIGICPDLHVKLAFPQVTRSDGIRASRPPILSAILVYDDIVSRHIIIGLHPTIDDSDDHDDGNGKIDVLMKV